jgi:hypothetical protein
VPATLGIFKNSTSKTLRSSQWESKASDPWPFCSNMLSLSSIPKPHALIGYLSLHTLGLDFLWLVVLLGSTVLSHRKVFPSLYCWVWLVLSVDCVGLPSVVLWGDRGEIRCYGLSIVWNGGEGCDLHGLSLIMLKSPKDWVLGVDTAGQPVPPRVRYGTTCFLIRDDVGCVPCLDEWEFSVVTGPG